MTKLLIPFDASPAAERAVALLAGYAGSVRGLGAAHHALIGSVALKAATLCTVPALLVP